MLKKNLLKIPNLLQKIRINSQFHMKIKKNANIKFEVTTLNNNNGLNTTKNINLFPNNEVIKTKKNHKINFRYSIHNYLNILV